MAVVTRFAPSPTGLLHLGHAYAAWFAADAARAGDGRFLLRLEDIDRSRCRPEFEAEIFEDLRWLGLTWPEPVRRQSAHFDDYRRALTLLEGRGLLYPCFCTRADIRREIERSPTAPHGPDGPLYSGRCRALSQSERSARMAGGESYALRLDLEQALSAGGNNLTFHDRARGAIRCDPRPFGDVVLARKDTPASYHLAVTFDDDAQGVTLVTRGEDLLPSTHVHRLLQALLGLATPEYHHHRLLIGPDGKRFAKRDQAATLQSLRNQGHSPEELRAMVGLDRGT